MRLIKVPDLKSFLEITVTTQDTLLALINDLVSSRIEKWLNRNLTKTAYSVYFNSGRKFYYLPAYPIDTSATLTVTYDGTVQTLDDDYYVWATEGLIEFDDETVYCDPKEVLIAWTGGYTETAISEVLGTDGLNYKCILTHTATAANKPVTGVDYATYWSQTGSSGVAWASGTQYLDHAYLSGIPDDIRLAAIMQMAFTFRRRKDIGLSSITLPDGSISKNVPVKLLDEVMDILRPYRRIPTVT